MPNAFRTTTTTKTKARILQAILKEIGESHTLVLMGFPHCRGRKVLAASAASAASGVAMVLALGHKAPERSVQWGVRNSTSLLPELDSHVSFIFSSYFAFKIISWTYTILQQSKVGYYAFAAWWRIMLSAALLGPVTLFTIVARLRIKQATKVLVLVAGIFLSASISRTYVYLYMLYGIHSIGYPFSTKEIIT